ncbi:hypothetical protein SAMN04488540_101267 [Ferrimonas sediminum]|uniref:Intracellular sulfur oxidation protein, DsrE/DsrF family n=1 Tax=Ferrimonas sediminum TaxID=718193 RepID=A0A1G8K5V1_9GAMM|nr:hypothetical protein [Ferrimonas sediminum]SDI38876.1 hypothetical protein SAMN04488540_101267 [Ferrimonas sediminum]
MKKISKFTLLAGLFGTALLTAGCGSDSDSTLLPTEPNDRVALAGETTGKLFFDINLADADKLGLYFDVILETNKGLEEQGVEPKFVIAFRGPSVTLINDAATANTKTVIKAMAELPNVRLEACSVATELFGVDNATILPEIVVVGNTFISSMGYQAVGYAPVLIQ